MADLRNPDSIDWTEAFQHPLNRFNDALLASQPTSMNDIFKELRERGFETEDGGESE